MFCWIEAGLGLSRKDQLIERCTVPVLGKVATQCWVPLPMISIDLMISNYFFQTHSIRPHRQFFFPVTGPR